MHPKATRPQGDALRFYAWYNIDMAIRKTPFALDEWYHCYNRGVDKRTTYEDRGDYRRFLEQLHLANSTVPLRRDDITARTFEEIVRTKKKEPLVSIGAFCLMPNHFHLVLKEITEGGITKLMQKLGTAYTMYFNERHERTGNLFLKPFRSRHVHEDRYFQHLINYVHCNPAELYEPGWKAGKVKNYNDLAKRLIEYPYSSLGAYEDAELPVRNILDEGVFEIAVMTPAKHMVREASEYYLENPTIP